MARDRFITAITEFDQLPVPGGVFELDGTILTANLAATQLLGRPVDQIVGRKAWDFAPGGEHIWDSVLADARKQGTVVNEITIATPVGTRAISYSVTIRSYEDRTIALIFALPTDGDNAAHVSSDDTKQRLEALGLVAGGIAHDFNNQLVSVLAEASAAREDPMLGESSREALRRIEGAAHRMAQLTRQLLAYAGRGRFVTELIDPDELLRKATEQLVRSVRSDAALEIRPGAGQPVIEADRGLLLQVFANLVTNASESLITPGGRITIVTRTFARDNATWWMLEVTDTGGGMDTRTAARIFDPFFTTKSDRHGLGLSAVHGIVRRLGGEISVDSVIGRGTTIRAQLPIIPGVQPKRKMPTTSLNPPIARLRGLRVLVADDEPSVRTTVKRLLERRGATVAIAVDGREAEERLRADQFDLVILDVMMPQATGYQLLPIARETQPTAKVMLMSGYTEQTRRAGSDDEPDAFLEKPFTAKVLDQAIDQLLEQR